MQLKRKPLLSVIAIILIGTINVIVLSADNPDLISPRSSEDLALQDVGSFAQWSKVELDFTGPESEAAGSDNPFTIIMDVTFTSPEGQEYDVPAFYDGDGQGQPDGDVWRVRFSPNEPGQWRFESTSTHPLLDGYNGTFTVTAPKGCPPYEPGDLPDFNCVGWLQYAKNERYLRFADGTYWVKGGSDDPEDFLAAEQTVGFESKEAAIDFLAEHGVNSQYILLSNIDGDGQNVWPWLGATQAEAKENTDRFDIPKLTEWESVFSYLQSKGIVLHLVWEDDSAWTGFNRNMFYREMIARFSHHNGLYWNLGEEYNESYSPNQIREFSSKIQEIDPYNHPITVHNEGSLNNWAPFIGDTNLQLTSLQTELLPQNEAAVAFFEEITESGHIIPIAFDETGKIAASARGLSRHIVWSVMLAGAGFELHMSPMQSFEQFSNHLNDMHHARTLIESLPFTEMMPQNEALISGHGYVFAKPGEVYAIYLPDGGSAQLELPADSSFSVQWFDPRTGSIIDGKATSNGTLGQPPQLPDEDWVIVVTQQ